MELFKLLGTIAIDTAQADQALDKTAKKAEGTGSKAESAFAKIGGAAKKVGTAVFAAGSALGGAWLAAIEGSREYRTEMGKLDAAFVTNGHSSSAAKKTYQDLQAVLGETNVSVEAANHLALLTDNEKDLQSWTKICTGVFATFGDSLPIEGLTESANETAKVAKLTGPLTDAIVWAGISEDDFNKKLEACTNEQERQRLIMETLNTTYSKASEQYQKTNKDVMDANRAQENLNSAMAELGRVGEPILTAIKNKVAEMVQVAVPLLDSFISKFEDANKWVKNNKNTLDTWAAAIIAVTVTIGTFLLIMKWGTILGAATKAVKATRAAILLFNAALLANPIALVVSLIAGLVAAFIYLWNNNKAFREFWIGLWEKIKSVSGIAVQWIKNKFNDLKSAVSNVKSRFEEIRKGITEKIEAAKEAVRKAIEKIKGFFDFEWSLPKLKMPSIGITGKFGIDPPSAPKFNLKWNAEGGILNKPTIFGMTETGTLLGGGEAGEEAIAPIDVLQGYVQNAVRAENEGVRKTIIEQMQNLITFLRETMPEDVRMDTGALVGALTPAIDRSLSDQWNQNKRGNTR